MFQNSLFHRDLESRWDTVSVTDITTDGRCCVLSTVLQETIPKLKSKSRQFKMNRLLFCHDHIKKYCLASSSPSYTSISFSSSSFSSCSSSVASLSWTTILSCAARRSSSLAMNPPCTLLVISRVKQQQMYYLCYYFVVFPTPLH